MRDEDFEWADVVRLARDYKYGAKITGATTAAPSQKSGNPFLPAPDSTQKPPASAPPPPRQKNTKWPTCTLCSRLGVGGDRHTRETCFIDVNSPMYKPEVR